MDVFHRAIKVLRPESPKKTRAATPEDPFKDEEWPFPPQKASTPPHASTGRITIEDKGSDDTDLEPVRCPSSIDLEPPVPVPRSKRRGLCGRFTLLAEVEDPRSYPRRVRWFITFVVAVAGTMAPMGSSIFFRA